MTSRIAPLTFNTVDDLGFAATNGSIDEVAKPTRYAAKTLGPLVELLHLCRRLPNLVAESWISPNGAAPMIRALREGQESWLNPVDRRMGFIRAHRTGAEGNNRFSAFLMDAQRAAREVTGLQGTIPGQLAAAIEELEGNIHEHSEAADSGLVSFRAAHNIFEFVAADHGVGLLRSLQNCAIYASLSDHGKALEQALRDGVSRFGPNIGRGNGFRPIFVGLANLKGVLRFRSGDHALLMDGTSPSLMTARLAQKPSIDGFLASVTILV